MAAWPGEPVMRCEAQEHVHESIRGYCEHPHIPFPSPSRLVLPTRRSPAPVANYIPLLYTDYLIRLVHTNRHDRVRGHALMSSSTASSWSRAGGAAGEVGEVKVYTSHTFPHTYHGRHVYHPAAPN